MERYITDFKTTDESAVALEDSIMLKDNPVTAGSKILENFIAPFDATVVERLKENNIKISGKTAMDEFGISDIITGNMNDRLGAIEAVVNGENNTKSASYALCNDLFGFYRKQAAENGLCYIHPTYGTVSRFGLIPLASSMDQIGVLCDNVADGFNLFAKIAGNDPRDGAMFQETKYIYEKQNKKLTVGIPSNIINKVGDEYGKIINDFAGKFDTADIELPYSGVYAQTMRILSSAEICNNLNRYDGIKFGYRTADYKNLNDIYVNTRTEAFGFDVKQTLIMGSLVLSHDYYEPFYEKAMKVRRLIKESLPFDKCDVIALPTEINSDPSENLSLHALTALAGLPSVSFSNKGCGLQLVADAKNENALLTAWEEISI